MLYRLKSTLRKIVICYIELQYMNTNDMTCLIVVVLFFFFTASHFFVSMG